MSEVVKSLLRECDRIQEDSEFSFKEHYNAAGRWEKINLWIGIPSTIFTATIGVISYNNFPVIGLALGIFSAGMIAILTFLNPSERAQKHKSAAGCYHSLRNQARIFKEIEVPNSKDEAYLRKRLLEMAEQRDQLNHLSSIVPKWAYEKAKKDVEEGRTVYRVDKE